MMTKTANEPSLALAISNNGDSTFKLALEPANFEAAYRVAAMAAKIQLCGVTTPEDALVRMMTGRELGLTAFQSMRLVYVVEGRPALDASLMLALCLNHRECEYFDLVSTSDKEATYRAKRKGRTEVVLSWTIEQAKSAGLIDRGKDPAKNNWNRYPSAMLRARCTSALARIVFPDAISGLYTREEVSDGDDVPPRGNELVGEVVSPVAAAAVPQAAPARDLDAEAGALKQRIADSKTKDERRAVRAEVAAFLADAGEPWATDVRRFYNLTIKPDATSPQEPPPGAGDSWEAPQ